MQLTYGVTSGMPRVSQSVSQKRRSSATGGPPFQPCCQPRNVLVVWRAHWPSRLALSARPAGGARGARGRRPGPSSWQGALVPSRVALPPVALPSPQSEPPAPSLAPRRVQFSAAGPSGVCSSERDVGCSRWKLPCRLCVLFTPFRRCVAFVRIRHDCPPEQAHSRLNTSHLEASWGEAAPGP